MSVLPVKIITHQSKATISTGRSQWEHVILREIDFVISQKKFSFCERVARVFSSGDFSQGREIKMVNEIRQRNYLELKSPGLSAQMGLKTKINVCVQVIYKLFALQIPYDMNQKQLQTVVNLGITKSQNTQGRWEEKLETSKDLKNKLKTMTSRVDCTHSQDELLYDMEKSIAPVQGEDKHLELSKLSPLASFTKDYSHLALIVQETNKVFAIVMTEKGYYLFHPLEKKKKIDSEDFSSQYASLRYAEELSNLFPDNPCFNSFLEKAHNNTNLAVAIITNKPSQ